jgi:hypothetical protein
MFKRSKVAPRLELPTDKHALDNALPDSAPAFIW